MPRLASIWLALGLALLVFMGGERLLPHMRRLPDSSAPQSMVAAQPKIAFSAFSPTLTPLQGVAKPAPGGRQIPLPARTIVAAQKAAPPPTPSPAPASEALRQVLDQYLNDLVNTQLFHGAVLVARHGELLLSKGYGPADIGQGRPITSHTRFRLASLTKQFTAMAIMQLQAEGKLKVQDPICAYVPDCPPAWAAVTIQQLLTHTSGIPSYTDFMDYEPTQMQPATPQQLVARFRDLPLNFQPGAAYSYGNSGYVLLGTIIEHVSGQSYEAFVHGHIFAPLHMDNSGVDHQAPGADQAIGYLSFDQPAPALDTSTLFAAGSLYSTVEDMYRWDQALYSEQLLPKPLLDEMFTPGLSNYGYGWKITMFNGHRRISHPGMIDGFATAIVRFPDDQVTVIVLSNMSSVYAEGVGDYLAQLVFNMP